MVGFTRQGIDIEPQSIFDSPDQEESTKDSDFQPKGMRGVEEEQIDQDMGDKQLDQVNRTMVDGKILTTQSADVEDDELGELRIFIQLHPLIGTERLEGEFVAIPAPMLSRHFGGPAELAFDLGFQLGEKNAPSHQEHKEHHSDHLFFLLVQ